MSSSNSASDSASNTAPAPDLTLLTAIKGWNSLTRRSLVDIAGAQALCPRTSTGLKKKLDNAEMILRRVQLEQDNWLQVTP